MVKRTLIKCKKESKKTFKNQKNFNKKHLKNLQKYNNKMVDKFVAAQTLSQMNDSINFDGSFEIKPIQVTIEEEQQQQNLQHQQLQRHHACVTELDREKLMKFVENFEIQRKCAENENLKPATSTSVAQAALSTPTSLKSTPRSSPNAFCRRAMAIYQNAFINNSSRSRSSSPKADQQQQSIYETVQVATVYINNSNTNNNETTTTTLPTNFQRSQPERSSLRSAAKLLQLFSAKKRSKKSASSFQIATSSSANNSSGNSSVSGSPVLVRAHHNLGDDFAIGCRTLPHSDNDDYDDEPDDGISSASSNFTQSSSGAGSSSGAEGHSNWSPDSSFEMHPPLVPSFKVTPPQLSKTNKNPAYEFARFLRGSFHAKRASVTKLRRSMSDPDAFQNYEFDKQAVDVIKKTNKQQTNKKATTTAAASAAAAATAYRTVLIDTTNVTKSTSSRATNVRVSHF